MNITIKPFDELSTQELYDILRLRSEVFVVEQTCIYQDVDDKDQKALHLLGSSSKNLVAYLRIFGPGDYFKNTSIGRVVVDRKSRGKGYAKDILKAAIRYTEENFGNKKIELSAQTYLIQFYSDLGFKAIGKEYLEDDIPHIKMVYD